MTDFLAKLRSSATQVAIVAVLLVVGYAFGRYFTPPRVETKTQVVTKVEVKEVVKTVEVAAKARVVTRYVRVKPDGDTTIHERETEDSRSETKTDETKHEDAVTERVVTKVVSAPATWGVALMGGVVGLGGSATPSWALGVQASGRVFGPVRAGVWGLYAPATQSGAAGALVGLDF